MIITRDVFLFCDNVTVTAMAAGFGGIHYLFGEYLKDVKGCQRKNYKISPAADEENKRLYCRDHFHVKISS